MKIGCLCCSYKRPQLLSQAIESFLRQNYPTELRELIVLDDAGQYSPDTLDEFPNVKLVTTRHRFRTLGEKRNATAGLVSPDVDAYCVWDDDDIYLPWHISAAVKALQNADYTIPTLLYVDKRTRLERKENQYLFHGAWAFRRSAFEQVGGYPFIQSGQDQGLLKRFKSAKLRRGDPLQFDPRPSYVYRWYTAHSSHLSALGSDGYERLAQIRTERVTELQPHWDRDWVALSRAAEENTHAKVESILVS